MRMRRNTQGTHYHCSLTLNFGIGNKKIKNFFRRFSYSAANNNKSDNPKTTQKTNKNSFMRRQMDEMRMGTQTQGAHSSPCFT